MWLYSDKFVMDRMSVVKRQHISNIQNQPILEKRL